MSEFKTVLQGDHSGWAAECIVGEPVEVRPWLSAVELAPYGGSVWRYRSVCRRCGAEVEPYSDPAQNFCPGCGASLAFDGNAACVVCGTRYLLESLKQQHPGKSLVYVAYGECLECGHSERKPRFATPDGGWVQYQPLTLSDLPGVA